MSDIGILKEFDKLGRIVIPKEMRERYGFNSAVEIIATKDGVLINQAQHKQRIGPCPCTTRLKHHS